MKYELALALQRITVLEKKLSDCENDKVVKSKLEQRVIKLLTYLETHEGITTPAAIKLLKVTHHNLVHRAMKACAANNSELQLSKTKAGKLILRINKG